MSKMKRAAELLEGARDAEDISLYSAMLSDEDRNLLCSVSVVWLGFIGLFITTAFILIKALVEY